MAVMNRFAYKLDNSAKLAAIAGLATIAFAVYGFYCFNTVSQVKINGPQYHRIAMGHELVADVLPPSEYLVETYLVAFEMMDADGADLLELILKSRRLKQSFLERNAYWNSVLTDDSLKRALGDAVHSGNEMIETLESSFIPAIQSRNFALSHELLDKTMRRQFREHRERVDAVVRMASASNRRNETSVARMVRDRTLGQVIIGFSLVILLAAGCFGIVCKFEANLKKRVLGMLTGVVPLSRDIRDKIMWN